MGGGESAWKKKSARWSPLSSEGGERNLAVAQALGDSNEAVSFELISTVGLGANGPDEGGVSDWSEWHGGFGRLILNPTARNCWVRPVYEVVWFDHEALDSSLVNSISFGFLIYQLRSLPI